jgi:hypothetical protein
MKFFSLNPHREIEAPIMRICFFSHGADKLGIAMPPLRALSMDKTLITAVNGVAAGMG